MTDENHLYELASNQTYSGLFIEVQNQLKKYNEDRKKKIEKMNISKNNKFTNDIKIEPKYKYLKIDIFKYIRFGMHV